MLYSLSNNTDIGTSVYGKRTVVQTLRRAGGRVFGWSCAFRQLIGSFRHSNGFGLVRSGSHSNGCSSHQAFVNYRQTVGPAYACVGSESRRRSGSQVVVQAVRRPVGVCLGCQLGGQAGGRTGGWEGDLAFRRFSVLTYVGINE